MKKLLLILTLFISTSAFSQTDSTTSTSSDWVKHPTEDRYIPSNTVPFSAILLGTLLVTLYLYQTPILRKVNQYKTKWQTNL